MRGETIVKGPGASVKPASGAQRSAEILTPLPPLRINSPLYLAALFVLALGFYIILLAGLLAAGAAIYFLTQGVLTVRYFRGLSAIEALAGLYLMILFFGYAIIRGLFVKVGSVPFGIRLNRVDHAELFLVTDKIARHVDTKPIERIYLTPGDDIGVREETALYMPPGVGARHLTIGMGALCYLTLDQLMSVLAHEYGHFSNKDTYFSNFIWRVSASYSEMLSELRSQKGQMFNPFVWILAGYVIVYRRLQASFSRRKEFRADRFAVEALGQGHFKDAMLTSHIEGQYFSAVVVPQVIRQAGSIRGFANVYRYAGIMRKRLEQEKPEVPWEIATNILQQRTKAGDSHPCLKERLAAQGIKVTMADLSPAPRVAPSPVFDKKARQDELDLIRSGPVSAAERIFHEQLHDLQVELSQMATAYWRYVLRVYSASRGGSQ